MNHCRTKFAIRQRSVTLTIFFQRWCGCIIRESLAKESKSKYFAHCTLEIWTALYPDKLFGPNNKNIISYSMATMVYVEIE